ncbi:vitamin B12-dependent ribonucleotide reductase [bacterium]|nr:vitamin B12-dependent ribonucleotide reductase [bacterium]RQV98679.1 MAG: vitamin B12-dependent ribonucleotide reductase [bacterium]
MDNLFDSDDNGHEPNTDTLLVKHRVPCEGFQSSSQISDVEKDENTIEISFSNNALKVLERRYLKKDKSGKVIETPVDLFRRVAHFIASADSLYDPTADLKKTEDTFFSLLANLEFLPNSPTLMNADRELGQLSACFVLPIEDSMHSIFEAVKNTALIHKSGGGTGFSFSRLRPQNDIVKSTHGIASGPISFMQVFDAATETVKQGGTRRGANMAILRVDHPDITDFIRSKEENNKLNNFNISVAITEKFWNALKNDKEYALINPHSKEKVGSLKAKIVFNDIVHHAWKNGDPGVIFIDCINKTNPTPQLGEIESTNPCGEQPLLPYESCNLGSINLAKMVKKNNDRPEIDFQRLLKTVRTAVHFLDNVIDMNKFPLPEIEKQSKQTRKIGLGVMGFADLLIHLNIPYNSQQAIDTAHQIMRFVSDEAKKKSQELALKRGEFSAFSKSIYARNNEPKIRNATRTTIAPTGTISIIANCSSGIEPLFALSFTRNVMDNDQLPEIHPLFCDHIKKEGLYNEEFIRKVGAKGSLEEIDNLPKEIKEVFITSHEISPEWHIRMQAAFQEHTDNAVSKTVNFHNKATEKDVAHVYSLAHDLGCKGVTIYRDGSRDQQVLNKGLKKKSAVGGNGTTASMERPRILRGFTTRLNTGQGSLYVTINTDENNAPVEVFANIGKSGGDTAALAEAIGRLISISLQKGVKVEEISQTLMGITGSKPVWNEGNLVKSVPDGIGQILLHEFGTQNKEKTKSYKLKPVTYSSPSKTIDESDISILRGPECPECGNTMETEGGCSVCRYCGYSHCG